MEENGVKYHVKNLLQIVGFAVCGVLVVLLLSAIFRPDNVNNQNIAGFYGEKKNTLDVVYMGGSAVFVYWQPLTAYENYGITSYDYAADTMQAEMYSYLIKEVQKTQDPDVLIIDARAFQYRDSNMKPTGAVYRNVLSSTPFSIERAQIIEEIIPKYLPEDEDKWSYHFDLALYHTRYGELPYDIDYQLKVLRGEYEHPYKGYFTIKRTKKIKKNHIDTKEINEPSEETAKILDEMISQLKDTGKKVLFVVSPYEETNEHKKIYNWVEQKVTSAGFDFLDANEHRDEMGLDYDNDFYNDSHVNMYGSNKYTDFLAKYLKEHYELVDRREDANYDSWDDLLENWHVYKKETINELEEKKKHV